MRYILDEHRPLQNSPSLLPLPSNTKMSFEEEFLPGVHGTAFYTRLYRPTAPLRGVLVFIHGYDEHISRYETMHSAWATRGFALFAYDLRGFGRTALDPKKSPDSAYGKMGDALVDLEWAIKHTRSLFPAPTPLFLMGHSMGGAIALEYFTSKSFRPNKEISGEVSGVISSSPWIILTNPLPTVVQWIFGLISKFFPNAQFSTPTRPKAISHDLSIGEALIADPWVRQYGTYAGIYERLIAGINLAKDGHKRWPKSLPLLVLHGTEDDMNLCSSSEAFVKAIDADDKQLILYPGAFHDLMSEPDVKDQYQVDCISWVEVHVSTTSGVQGSRSAWKGVEE